MRPWADSSSRAFTRPSRTSCRCGSNSTKPGCTRRASVRAESGWHRWRQFSASFVSKGRPYHLIAARAGEYTADWTVAELSPFRKKMILAMPPAIRKRMVVGIAQWMAQSTYGDTNVKVQWRQWRGSVDLKSSLFCEVRDRVKSPLCEFYASALRRLMSTFNLDADVVMDECRATGATRCAMSVTVRPAPGRAA